MPHLARSLRLPRRFLRQRRLGNREGEWVVKSCFLALVSYEFGARPGSAQPASVPRFPDAAYRMPGSPPLPSQAAAVPYSLDELAMREKLATPPVVTPPPIAQSPSGAANPFGLHP